MEQFSGLGLVRETYIEQYTNSLRHQMLMRDFSSTELPFPNRTILQNKPPDILSVAQIWRDFASPYNRVKATRLQDQSSSIYGLVALIVLIVSPDQHKTSLEGSSFMEIVEDLEK